MELVRFKQKHVQIFETRTKTTRRVRTHQEKQNQISNRTKISDTFEQEHQKLEEIRTEPTERVKTHQENSDEHQIEPKFQSILARTTQKNPKLEGYNQNPPRKKRQT